MTATHARLIVYVWCAALTLAIMIATIVVFYPSQDAANLRFYFLNVGEGDATLLQLPKGTTILIDAGPDNSVLAALGTILPWWQRRIDAVIITHPDTDHYAGILGIMESYSIGAVYYNGGTTNDQYFSLVKRELEKRRIPISVITQGNSLVRGTAVSFTALWPPNNDVHLQGNSRSLVILVRYGTVAALFPGDLPKKEEEALIGNNVLGRVDILHVAHHGSNSSSGQRFLEIIRPHYCVVSAGLKNKYGHPNRAVLDRLRQLPCTLIETAQERTQSLITDGHTLRREP